GLKNANSAPANPLLASRSIADPHLASGHAVALTRRPTTTATVTGTVANVAPTLTSISVSPTPLNEGSSVSLSGQFTDPSSADTFPVSVNWGDGSQTQTIPLGAGATSFNAGSHTYVDNGAYSVSVYVTDDDSGQSNTQT